MSVTFDASPAALAERVHIRGDGTRAPDVVFDITLDELEADPFPIYVWMRRELPIAFVPEVGRVFLTTWDLCADAGANDAIFGPTSDPFLTVYGPNVMSLTGDAHRELRNALNPPFRPRAVNDYTESHLRPTAVRYVEAVRDRGSAEACGEVLEPISLRAVGDVMGFTDVDDETIGRWFRAYAAYLVDFGRDEQVAAEGRVVKQEVLAYLEERIPRLVAEPDGSALSHMVHDGMPAGQTRSAEDLIGTMGVMIVGGIQEPAHGAANTLFGLLGRPEQAARVAADPQTWSRRAIEEGLRWISPFGMTEKLTTADVVLGGLTIPAGTEIAMVIGSANRDPSRFADPDVYDLDRDPQGHQSFGYGVHFCIGHYVARVLGQVMLEEMFRRLPGLRLDPEREPFVHGWANRAAVRLPVVWDT